MPPKPVPDLPARNPPTLTPAPPSGVSSRIVRALAGQTVEVPFRGTGWVYLGEASSKRGVDYASRRLDAEGQTFVFRAGETGVYELKFYRQDFIRDYIINDVVTLIVEDPPPRSGGAPGRGVVVAEPRWPTLAGAPETGTPASRAESETPAGGAPASRAGTPAPAVVEPAGVPAAGGEPSPLLPQDTAAEDYLSRAREEYQGERYPQSRAMLDQFLERFPRGSDEAYWLYAQLCEKQGPSRDIRLALDYYRRLVAEYPQSGHYNDARRRIAYLERYYINIQ
jgi:tetratricopeptide (TPR) repeat protein